MEPEGSLPHSQALSCLQVFLNMNVLQGGVVSTSPNPQAGGPPLVDCPRLLIQFIRSYPLHWRPFLYSQPEDAPCRGDRDPLPSLFVGLYESASANFWFDFQTAVNTNRTNGLDLTSWRLADKMSRNGSRKRYYAVSTNGLRF